MSEQIAGDSKAAAGYVSGVRVVSAASVAGLEALQDCTESTVRTEKMNGAGCLSPLCALAVELAISGVGSRLPALDSVAEESILSWMPRAIYFESSAFSSSVQIESTRPEVVLLPLEDLGAVRTSAFQSLALEKPPRSRGVEECVSALHHLPQSPQCSVRVDSTHPVQLLRAHSAVAGKGTA